MANIPVGSYEGGGRGKERDKERDKENSRFSFEAERTASPSTHPPEEAPSSERPPEGARDASDPRGKESANKEVPMTTRTTGCFPTRFFDS